MECVDIRGVAVNAHSRLQCENAHCPSLLMNLVSIRQIIMMTLKRLILLFTACLIAARMVGRRRFAFSQPGAENTILLVRVLEHL